jgi:hypothetical protein
VVSSTQLVRDRSTKLTSQDNCLDSVKPPYAFTSGRVKRMYSTFIFGVSFQSRELELGISFLKNRLCV